MKVFIFYVAVLTPIIAFWVWAFLSNLQAAVFAFTAITLIGLLVIKKIIKEQR